MADKHHRDSSKDNGKPKEKRRQSSGSGPPAAQATTTTGTGIEPQNPDDQTFETVNEEDAKRLQSISRRKGTPEHDKPKLSVISKATNLLDVDIISLESLQSIRSRASEVAEQIKNRHSLDLKHGSGGSIRMRHRHSGQSGVKRPSRVSENGRKSSAPVPDKQQARTSGASKSSERSKKSGGEEDKYWKSTAETVIQIDGEEKHEDVQSIRSARSAALSSVQSKRSQMSRFSEIHEDEEGERKKSGASGRSHDYGQRKETVITLEAAAAEPEPPPPPRRVPSKFIHELVGAFPRKRKRVWCETLRNLFPREVPLSSYPEIVYYTMNIIFCVVATYMAVMMLSCTGWAKILVAMRNRLPDQRYLLEPKEQADILELYTTARILATNVAIIVFSVIIGSAGMYESVKSLQLTHMIGICIAIGLQVLASYKLERFYDVYCDSKELKLNFNFHLSSYYKTFENNSVQTLSINKVPVNYTPEYFLSKNLVDGIQHGLDCCGYDSYEEYLHLEGIENEVEYPIPHSCCNSQWRNNLFCHYLDEDKGDEYDAKIYVETGCGNNLEAMCDTVSSYVGGITGFIIALIMVPPLLVCLFCIQYNWIAFKMLQERELITVEKVHLPTPLQHVVTYDIDGLPERHLITDTDQVKLSEELTVYIHEIRELFGLNDMLKKEKVFFSKINEFASFLPKYMTNTTQPSRNVKRMSFVAGRHNYMLNREVLGYAAKVVTQHQDIDLYTKLKTFQIRRKVRTLRHYSKRKTRDIVRQDATYPWRFYRRTEEADRKKEIDWVRKRIKQIVQATVEGANEERLPENLSPEELQQRLQEIDAGAGRDKGKKFPKIDKYRTGMPQTRTTRWIMNLKKALAPSAKLGTRAAASLASGMESTATASTIMSTPMPGPSRKVDKPTASKPNTGLQSSMKKNKIHPVETEKADKDV